MAKKRRRRPRPYKNRAAPGDAPPHTHNKNGRMPLPLNKMLTPAEAVLRASGLEDTAYSRREVASARVLALNKLDAATHHVLVRLHEHRIPAEADADDFVRVMVAYWEPEWVRAFHELVHLNTFFYMGLEAWHSRQVRMARRGHADVTGSLRALHIKSRYDPASIYARDVGGAAEMILESFARAEEKVPRLGGDAGGIETMRRDLGNLYYTQRREEEARAEALALRARAA